MSDSGYIKLHQNFMDREWYGDSDMARTYLHILLSVNDKESNCCGETVKRGSLYTSCEGLARELTLSVKSVRTALRGLKAAEEIEIKDTKRGIIITLTQRDIYQIPQDDMEVFDNA